jgi:hypothetical protein
MSQLSTSFTRPSSTSRTLLLLIGGWYSPSGSSGLRWAWQAATAPAIWRM